MSRKAKSGNTDKRSERFNNLNVVKCDVIKYMSCKEMDNKIKRMFSWSFNSFESYTASTCKHLPTLQRTVYGEEKIRICRNVSNYLLVRSAYTLQKIQNFMINVVRTSMYSHDVLFISLRILYQVHRLYAILRYMRVWLRRKDWR